MYYLNKFGQYTLEERASVLLDFICDGTCDAEWLIFDKMLDAVAEYTIMSVEEIIEDITDRLIEKYGYREV